MSRFEALANLRAAAARRDGWQRSVRSFLEYPIVREALRAELRAAGIL